LSPDRDLRPADLCQMRTANATACARLSRRPKNRIFLTICRNRPQMAASRPMLWSRRAIPLRRRAPSIRARNGAIFRTEFAAFR